MKKKKKANNANRVCKKLFFCILAYFFTINVFAQTCPITNPIFFGIPGNYIYCRNDQVQFGVFNSDSTTGQVYVFSVYRGGVETSRKAGPLDGNGGQLSVSAYMRSPDDAGEYRITSFNTCGDTARINFDAFYGSIDNLSITAWGSDGVSFKWASCEPSPAVTYEYAVTTNAIPPSAGFQTTTDTIGSETGLTAGSTYYIHVRVNNVFWEGQDVPLVTSSNCPALTWQTIRFISCSVVTVPGFLTPGSTVLCQGNSVQLTASGGNSYQWYFDNNVIAGANSAIYNATLPGQYSVYLTTASGCEGIVASSTVLQTSIQTGTFFGGGCFNIGDSVRFGITPTIIGQTYKILKNGVEVATLEGIGQSFESFDTILYKFLYSSASDTGQYSVRTSNAYCADVDFGSQAISGFGSWGGTLSSDWFNPLNWKCGIIPDANTDVVINASATNFPVVGSNNGTCKSLSVEPGASITISPGFNLDITGD